MPSSAATSGIRDALRALGDTLITSVKDRVTLISVELQEEKLRLIQTFIWITATVFSVAMALTFASLTLVYAFWESARLAVFVALAVLYTGASVAVIIAFRRTLRRYPRPFSATLEELEKDHRCFSKDD
jgi:uncharacterized membrane protein YqjE